MKKLPVRIMSILLAILFICIPAKPAVLAAVVSAIVEVKSFLYDIIPLHLPCKA